MIGVIKVKQKRISIDTKDSYNVNNGLKEWNGDVDEKYVPYLAYENGGAAFLIAYLVLQFLIGKPMYFMELVMGQFSGLGPTGVWKMNPSTKGIGISMALISLVVAIYYNVIMAYTLIYFFSSMQKTLPWTVCEDEWLPLGCVEQSTQRLDYCSMNITQLLTDNKACRCFLNGTDSILSDQGFNCTNVTYQGDVPVPVSHTKEMSQYLYHMPRRCPSTCITYQGDVPVPVAHAKEMSQGDLMFVAHAKERCPSKPVAHAKEISHKTVINKADDFYPDTGNPQWKLALCLLLSWIVVVLCLVRGIKSSGKVVYFTATFPYVILLILLIRGATLDGAIDGVKYFLIPEWSKLADLKVWVAAAGQMFFSLSVSFGGIIMFGSYNKFSNNVYGDALLIAVMDLVTSIIAGFVIFTTFGGLAKKTGLQVSEVAREFALLETVLTCIQDEFPKLRKYKSHMCIGLGVICFFMALPCITPVSIKVICVLLNCVFLGFEVCYASEYYSRAHMYVLVHMVGFFLALTCYTSSFKVSCVFYSS
ncbi:Sodium- and chloride-dependent neutral and basic amino acid transporter B(0+),Sodium- and chloride-dependent taurine transporter,Sodium-dependent proline transporter,Sodium-dependent nutrient amino acid transporter 1,Creatine transporter,Sodium- and chloride-dependent transporter XTRP3A,Sodium- and chloride-dependent transporter XTRP3,Sodium-dependent neutral amino acid transporter SLC6A17,Sodium- and chloride-dependent betaine transporter,Sodium- and chloride-dependent GABA transporter 2,Sodium- and chlor|uniref:Uncharacterized protein n=1 Tax=Mytilus coruscus TaxID=42192 RepID=A0A6J8DGT9_MYTCO|nr:Sodium- and chloride-dependent neutral and basic amino acid transporter B(0+),Sodium- and chloride-dependent taurine transporter,Sodium-dependent proline transporter,Sodium-dependent nutrient amino acid transporter 1,Creatine transporter,Sodium- and chloride-dependent transporter XTRP3A,Sodium- and chloride-dependent transporter XTRP3,Sodium-dependent neutral amino acid transporter SLC6A17,Sodium- and chloride-dependent betaine transporter,Sodium- and chloride-dependent GABA transporter 2,Sodium